MSMFSSLHLGIRDLLKQRFHYKVSLFSLPQTLTNAHHSQHTKQKKKTQQTPLERNYPCVLRFITPPQPQGKAQKGEGNDSGWKGPTTVI